MHGIYIHIPETNHVPREYNVAAIIIIVIIIKHLIKEVAIFDCKQTNNNTKKITWVKQNTSVVYLLDTPGVFYLAT